MITHRDENTMKDRAIYFCQKAGIETSDENVAMIIKAMDNVGRKKAIEILNYDEDLSQANLTTADLNNTILKGFLKG